MQPLNPNHPAERQFYETYFSTPAEACLNIGYSGQAENELDVYVISFNHPLLVEYQIMTLRKFCRAPMNIVIVDNNNGLHPMASAAVMETCRREGVIYLQAPANFYQEPDHFDPTMKLGTTMSWLYYQCAQVRRPVYFGYLDHDCFLIQDLDIRPWLDARGMYGSVIRSKKDDAWNLHVTSNFFKLEFVGDRPLDFRASYPHELDTGGANYDVLYKDYQSFDYDLPRTTPRFAEQDVNRPGSVQHYEVVDRTWFHICATSHDQLAGDGAYKLAYAKGYLDSRLQL